MKKRLIDIYPPHQRSETSQEDLVFDRGDERSKEGGFSQLSSDRKTGVGFATLLIILFLAPPLFAHFFFARASVHIWPQVSKLHITEYITAQIGYDMVNVEEKIVRASLFAQEAEQTSLFPASGKAFREERARGTVRLYNENSTEPQALVANTRFISEDGKIFRAEKAISIPGGREDGRRFVPGVLDVPVVAAEPGEDYNIGPSKFSLPGLVGSPLYTKIYGETLRPMTGGARKEVTVVTEEDIAQAKEKLAETLTTQATKSLFSKIPPPFQVVGDSLTEEFLEDNSLVKPGAELDHFNYTAKIRVSVVGFHKEDADMIAKQVLSNYLASNETTNEETLQITHEAEQGKRKTGVIPIVIRIQADQYEKVDARALGGVLQGAGSDQFEQVIGKHPFLAKAKFSLWPFWISRIPKDPERIDLEVFLEG